MNRSIMIVLSVVIFIMMCVAAFMIWLLYRDVPQSQLTLKDNIPVERIAVEEEVSQKSPEEPKKEAVVEGLDRLDGPFSVKNGATGKENTLCRKDGCLVLSDENGVQSWSVPFATPLCGTACSIDYYSNGKIQFLFGSGESVYLYDRLGRPVKGFSLTLPKPILLGPQAYDFNGNKKYNILVLHTDNSVGLYDMKGNAPSKWLGISPSRKILAIPEYAEKDTRSYWIIRLEGGTAVYSFYGGDPIKTFDRELSRDDVLASI